jgi:hypothetical protein
MPLNSLQKSFGRLLKESLKALEISFKALNKPSKGFRRLISPLSAS